MKIKWLIMVLVLLLAAVSSGVLVQTTTPIPAAGVLDAIDANSIDVAGDVNVGGTGTFGDLIVDGNTLVVDNVNHRVGIGTATDMLAPLNITGDAASIEDRHEGIWIRGKTGGYIVQLNVRGSRLEIGGGASIDTEPAMSINYLTGDVNIGGTFTVGDATNRTLIDPNGDLTFKGTAGLAFGEIYAADVADTITITAQDEPNKVQITSFDVNGVFNNTTPDHDNDHILITVAGMYLCNVSIHAISTGGGGSDNYGYSVYKNNGATQFFNLHGQRDLTGGGGDEGSMTLSGIIDLAVNDTIEVWIWNNTNADDIVIDDINLSLVMVGGT